MPIKTEILFYDKKGNLIYQQEGHSLLKQFYQALFANFNYCDQTIKKIDGSTFTFHATDEMRPISDLVVGNDDTPVTYDDYRIKNELTGISYSSVSKTLSCSSTSSFIEIVRSVTETEGIDKEIKEVAIYSCCGGYCDYKFCIDRTVLDTSITLPANDTITIAWRLATIYT